MYYEIYADEFFFINFLIDCWLYSILKEITACMASKRTIILISAMESLMATILICLPLSWIIKALIVHVCINPMGIFYIFHKEKLMQKLSGYIFLYIATALLCGIMQALNNMLRLNCLILSAILVLSYFFVKKAFCHNKRAIYKKSIYVKVKIYINNKAVETVGIMDTGNSLTEPFSKKPVSVIEKDVLKDFLVNINTRICIIPYTSVGKENGNMYGIRADSMDIIMQERTYFIKKPILGISENTLSCTGDYKIIINPLLIS